MYQVGEICVLATYLSDQYLFRIARMVRNYDIRVHYSITKRYISQTVESLKIRMQAKDEVRERVVTRCKRVGRL